MATRPAAVSKLEGPRPKRTKTRCKTPLASENFVDVLSLLPRRWELDSANISCSLFRYILSTMMDTVCLRQFDSVRFPSNYPCQSTFTAYWRFTANGEEQDLLTSFCEMDEAIEDVKKRVTSSAVECFDFMDLHFTDEMLVIIVEALGSVHVAKLNMFNCNFSSTSEGSVRALISSFAFLQDLSLSLSLLPAHYANELLIDCARRPELTRAWFNVDLPDDVVDGAREVRIGPLDAGILALLFREVGEGVVVTFRRAWHSGAIISDGFSKHLLEKANQHTGTKNVKLTVMRCNTEQQMGRLADFQQFRRTVAASSRSPAKTIYELPANGRRMTSLTFSAGFQISPRELRFESVSNAAD